MSQYIVTNCDTLARLNRSGVSDGIETGRRRGWNKKETVLLNQCLPAQYPRALVTHGVLGWSRLRGRPETRGSESRHENQLQESRWNQFRHCIEISEPEENPPSASSRPDRTARSYYE